MTTPTAGRATKDWATYSDDEAIEITLWRRDRYTTRPPDNYSEFRRPTYRRTLGPATEATTLRPKCELEAERRVDAIGECNMNWGSVREITRAAALRALGKECTPDPLPWLKGRAAEKAEMDATLSELGRQCWENRRVETPW